MRKSKKSIYNIITALLYKLFVIIIGLIIPRIFILNYGSNLNGFQSSVGQIFSYIALIEAGIGEATLQAIYRPIAEKNHMKTNEILSATTKYYDKIGIIYFVILFLLAGIYPLFVDVPELSYLNIFIYIIVSGATTGINFFFVAKIGLVINAEGDTYWTSIMQFAIYIMTSTVKIFCILKGYNIVFIQAGYFAINMIYTLVLYIFAKRKYPWVNFRIKPDYKAIEQKDSVLLHKISGIIFQNTDVLILTFFCDLNTVSIYTIYKLVINSIVSFMSTISGSITFVFGQTFAVNTKRYTEIVDTFHVIYVTISSAILTVTYILYLPFIKLYTSGSDINYFDKWLPILFVGIEILLIGREAMMQTITVSGHFKQTLWRSLLESGINLGISLIMVQILGIYGVLIGTIVALLYRTLDIDIYANRHILERSSFFTLKVWGSNVLVMILVVMIVKKMDIINISTYIEFGIYGVILSIVIMILFLGIGILLNRKQYQNLLFLLKSLKHRN